MIAQTAKAGANASFAKATLTQIAHIAVAMEIAQTAMELEWSSQTQRSRPTRQYRQPLLDAWTIWKDFNQHS